MLDNHYRNSGMETLRNDLLESARQQAEKAEPSMRAAALLLRITRAESVLATVGFWLK
jgi:hypothetical protein